MFRDVVIDEFHVVVADAETSQHRRDMGLERAHRPGRGVIRRPIIQGEGAVAGDLAQLADQVTKLAAQAARQGDQIPAVAVERSLGDDRYRS